MTRRVTLDGREIVLRPLERGDLPGIGRFAASLPTHDLLFLARDIQHSRVIDAWMQSVDRGEIESLVAIAGKAVVGTTAIVRDPLGWSAHVAELRVLVAPEMRGKGLGRVMLEACIDLAIEGGATKLTARMTPDQAGAITLFEEAGFRAEAMLRDEVRDRDGKLHDLAIMALDPARFATRRDAFGDSATT